MSINEWTFIAIFLIVAALIPVAAIVLGALLGPRKPNPVKVQTYECGMETHGDTWVQIKAAYYIFALVFLVFDVEVVFLFPWAVAYNQLPLFAVIEGVVFILILAAALVYVWQKGALEWV